MAVLPDYVTGTITLANGFTTVTGTGTMFATAAFKAGDTLQIQNLTAVIASVDSNTSLTLTEPWTGTSLTNAPYRARYLPDGARVTAQTTTLIELLGNGVLSNIASIPVENGKLLRGNDAGQYEAVDQSQIGIQDPNGSLGKLAALTLAANKFIRTDASGDIAQSDIAAWAISMLGLAGAANKFPYLNAANTASLADITALGRALLALSSTNGNIPVMTGNGGIASRPIVGTVSQADGVPTGAIIERGSNANGEYVKYADGTLICTRSISYPGINITSVSNGIYFGAPETVRPFPAAFISEPAYTAVFLSGWIMWAVCDGIPTTTQWPAWYPFSDQPKTNQPARAKYVAIGRWF